MILEMVGYITKIANELIARCKKGAWQETPDLMRALAEELDRLDPRDFLANARFDFVMVRIEAGQWGKATTFTETSYRKIQSMGEWVVKILEQYGGKGSQVISRSFAFVKDTGLRQIIERDYRELQLKVFPSRAWKSSVVLAGSILEALLYDQLSADPTIRATALSSSKAPRERGIVKDLLAGKWKLEKLIDVSVDLSILPKDRAKTFDQILRDYRNFVHPKKELRAQHPCEEAEALMSVGALEGVCNILK
jgi:hypothetical protein